MKGKATVRLVRPRTKGQITIPADVRQQLNIDEDTILQLRVKGSTIEITPLRVVDENRLMREYSAADIEAFLREDKIDKKTATKLRRLLRG